MPIEVTLEDRIWLRCVRLMLDGHAVLVPRTTFHLTPPPQIPEESWPADGSLAAIVVEPPGPFDVCGIDIPIPQVRMYHPAAKFSWTGDPSPAAAVRKKPTRGEITVTVTGNDACLAYMPDRYGHEKVTPRPWGLIGVDEPAPLRGADE